MDPIQAILIALLIIVFAVREFFLHRERERVYDRLMAKNLPDFKDNEQLEENLPPEEDDEDTSVSLEDAQEEILGEEDDGKH